jgi:hypothetical protein
MARLISAYESKRVPVYATKECRENRVIPPPILNLGTSYG